MSDRDAFGNPILPAGAPHSGGWHPPVAPPATPPAPRQSEPPAGKSAVPHEPPVTHSAAPDEPPTAPPHAHPNPVPEPRTLLRRLAAPLIFLLALLSKLKGVLLVLAKLKFLTSAASMLVSIVAYASIWGWQFGVGFVALLFVHEMGHVIQLRREGLEASAPMFIPFMGAVVWAKSLGDNAVAEARVALAGPILGSLGAAACLAIYLAGGSELFRALAFTGFFLNLFNLLPVSPLDGGRAAAAISPWMWLLGVFGVAVLVFTHPNPILILIAFVAIWQTYHRFKAFREGGEEAKAYYAIGARARTITTLVYFGLVLVLAVAMYYTHLERTL